MVNGADLLAALFTDRPRILVLVDTCRGSPWDRLINGGSEWGCCS